jgi:hypothetical protein
MARSFMRDIALGLILVVATIQGYRSLPGHHPLYTDFLGHISAGRAVRAGLDSYALVRPPNLNPPILLPVFAALVPEDVYSAYAIWWAVSVAIILAVIIGLVRACPAARSPLRLAACVALTGVWDTLTLGQIYAPLLGLVFLAHLAMLKRHRVLGGVAIGLIVSIKPNFVIWPILLLVSGATAEAFAACTVAAALSTIPLVTDGPAIYRAWLAAAASYESTGWLLNGSLIGAAVRLGDARVGLWAAASLFLMAALAAWRVRPNPVEIGRFAIVITLLVSPLAWTGYTILLLPGLATAPNRMSTIAGWGVLCVPAFVVVSLASSSPLAIATAGQIYVLALGLVGIGFWPTLPKYTHQAMMNGMRASPVTRLPPSFITKER